MLNNECKTVVKRIRAWIYDTIRDDRCAGYEGIDDLRDDELVNFWYMNLRDELWDQIVNNTPLHMILVDLHGGGWGTGLYCDKRKDLAGWLRADVSEFEDWPNWKVSSEWDFLVSREIVQLIRLDGCTQYDKDYELSPYH